MHAPPTLAQVPFRTYDGHSMRGAAGATGSRRGAAAAPMGRAPGHLGAGFRGLGAASGEVPGDADGSHSARHPRIRGGGPEDHLHGGGVPAAASATVDGTADVGDTALAAAVGGVTALTGSAAFPDVDYIDNEQQVSLQLAQWMCGLAESGPGSDAGTYKSVGVFTEIRLKEIEVLAGQARNPNRLRAAVAMTLFDVLLRHEAVGACSHALEPIRKELARCIYTKEGLEKLGGAGGVLSPAKARAQAKARQGRSDMDRDGKHHLISPQDAQHSLERLLAAPTYFDRTRQLGADLAHASDKAATALSAAQAAWKRRFEAQAATDQQRMFLLARCYYHWLMVSRDRKTKELFGSLRRNGGALQAGPSVRDVFNALKRHADAQKLERAHESLRSVQDDHTSATESLAKQLERARKQNKALQAELALATQQLEALQREQSAHAELSELSEARAAQQASIAATCAALTRRAMDTAMRLTAGTVSEVERVPDAMLLRHVMRRRDIDEGAAEEYHYHGTGVVVPEESSDADDDDGSADGAAAAGGGGADAAVPKKPWKDVGAAERPATDEAEAAARLMAASRPAKVGRRAAKLMKKRKRAKGKPAAVGGRLDDVDEAASEEDGDDAAEETSFVEEVAELRRQAEAERNRIDAAAAAAVQARSRASSAAQEPGSDGEAAHADAAREAGAKVAADGSDEVAEMDDSPDFVLPLLKDQAAAERALARLPVDVVLMRWMNYHLAHSRLNGADYGRRVHNFAADLSGAEMFALVLRRVAPGQTHKKTAAAPDPFRRCELVSAELSALFPSAADFASPSMLFHGDASLYCAAVARLFTTHHGLTRPFDAIRPLQERVAALLLGWADVCGRVSAIGVPMHSKVRALLPPTVGPGGVMLPVAERGEDDADSDGSGARSDATSSIADDEVAEAERLAQLEAAAPAAEVEDALSTASSPGSSPRSQRDGKDGPAAGGLGAVAGSMGDVLSGATASRALPEELRRRLARARSLMLSSAQVEELKERVDEFTGALEGTTAFVAAHAAAARGGMYLWRALHAKVVGHMWHLFNERMMGREVAVVDEREAKELRDYTRVYPAKYKDLLDRYTTGQAAAAQQVARLEEALTEARAPLSRIFQYYCASGDGSSISSMCLSEYWAFLRDSGIAGGGFGDKKSARLDLIFHKCQSRSGLEYEDEHLPKKELVPAQFVEALTRIAVLLYEREFPGQTLAGALRKLLADKVLPNAIQSDTEGWRAVLASEPVREVFSKHRILLQRVFAAYARGEARVRGKRTTTINVSDFLRLLRDVQALDKTLTALAVKHIFAHTQVEEAFTDDAAVGGGEDEMIYSEFLEGVGSVAMFKFCSPYVSAQKRIDNFITEYIAAKARGGAKK